MSNEMTMEEFSETINGFEEIAIAKHFGEDWSTLPDNKPTMFMRALVYTDLVRTGSNPNDAKQACMSMTLKDANAYFAEEVEEPMPDEPVSESGKDDTPPELTPSGSPGSVS